MDKTKDTSLEWYFYVMFAVVAVVALVMTWWSMYDLGTGTLHAPEIVSAGVSLIFDIAAIYFGALAIKYAQTDDSGFLAELVTFALIATSTYIVIQHAIIDGYPAAGIVMYAAAPIVLGVMLKGTLHYLTRKQRREAGRVTERLPSVGWLTWLRYAPQSFRLASVAMQGRLINAAGKLDIAEDKHGIFGQTQTVHVPSVLTAETIAETPEDTTKTELETSDNSSQQLSQAVRPALTSPDTVSLPVWLPNEPKMSFGTLVRTCLDNGVLDLETMFRYAKDIKGHEVNKMSLRKALDREKIKLNG